MRKKNLLVTIALFLALLLAAPTILQTPANNVEAAKAVKLNKKKVTLTVGIF